LIRDAYHGLAWTVNTWLYPVDRWITKENGPELRAVKGVSPSGTTAKAGRGPDGGTEAAGRVADVLLLFVGGPASLGVSEIARELGLSKAVVHRILQSLAARQVVELDTATRGYRLGRAAVALGARALRDHDMRSSARPVLRRLRDATGETTTLSELMGDSRVYLDQFESPQEIKMTVELGMPHALHAGGSGKAILAFLPADVREDLLSRPLRRLTGRTVVDPEALRAELDLVRERGYAVSFGERRHGAGSVAAPVFGVDGEAVGSISVCGPVDRFDEAAVAAYVPQVLAAAAEVSRSLGWAGARRRPDHPAGSGVAGEPAP
jgi:IclR family transcriptional regulator, acetate operon repressor